MIKAAIFDLDGVLVDSIPIWYQTYRDIYEPYGVDITDEVWEELKGMRVDELNQYIKRKFRVTEINDEEIEALVWKTFEENVKSDIKPMLGVKEILEFCKSKDLKIAVGSSNSKPIIELILKELGIRHYFEAVHSADNEEYAKPNPAVFISAGKSLGVEPNEAIVLEDSFSGIIAGKAANMTVVYIPEPGKRNEKCVYAADLTLNNLTETERIEEII